MCGSNKNCKDVRQKIKYFSLEQHEVQLNKCYACLGSQTSTVHKDIAFKTDKKVRLSFIEKHYESISQLKRA